MIEAWKNINRDKEYVMKYSMEYQESFAQRICENLWKLDIHPYWKGRKGSKILEIVKRVCPYILLNVPNVEKR